MKTDPSLLHRLRKQAYGHGAFGELESYPPPSIQLEAADEIERLQVLLKAAILARLSPDELTALGISSC